MLPLNPSSREICVRPRRLVSIEALSFHAMQIDVMCKLWVKYANLVLASAEVTILVADVCGLRGGFQHVNAGFLLWLDGS